MLFSSLRITPITKSNSLRLAATAVEHKDKLKYLLKDVDDLRGFRFFFVSRNYQPQNKKSLLLRILIIIYLLFVDSRSQVIPTKRPEYWRHSHKEYLNYQKRGG